MSVDLDLTIVGMSVIWNTTLFATYFDQLSPAILPQVNPFDYLLSQCAKSLSLSDHLHSLHQQEEGKFVQSSSSYYESRSRMAEIEIIIHCEGRVILSRVSRICVNSGKSQKSAAG